MDYVNLNNTNIESIKDREAESAKKLKFLIPVIAVVVLFAVAGAGFLLFGKNVKALFDPVSIVGGISKLNIDETDGRTNILILGSDKRTLGEEAGNLTDTILVASIGKFDKDVVIISLPRDLWIRDYNAKINAIYAIGGYEMLEESLKEVIGIPIHYYAVINFEVFQEMVDVLGGVDVTVDTAFIDYRYPIEGKEKAPLIGERYEIVEFGAGEQTMDGETALKFVRSRHGNNNEGNDFARSQRQQKVIMAIKDKTMSVETLFKIGRIQELYETYQQNVDTNIDFGAIQSFYLLSQQIDYDAISTIVLQDERDSANNGGLLYAPEDRILYDGKYVLIPSSGDYSQIRAYVQRFLFGN